MRKFLFIPILFIFVNTISAQFKLIVNEVSQGSNGTKEYIELLVVGTRTCTDSTADIRNWLFDDQNGWYGGAGTGIAMGHYRFTNNNNWAAVPYGSVILIYNNADKNTSISLPDDPIDANHDYTYVVPINSPLIEMNPAEPKSPSSAAYVYPVTGYVPSTGWNELGLSNTGDAVIITSPSNLGAAEFSIIFGIVSPPGFQTPTVTTGPVAANKNKYLGDSLYATASSWITGNASTIDETPGSGNTAANTAWIKAMRMPYTEIPLKNVTQPGCTAPSGKITITSPVGAGYMYSTDAASFQSNPVFANLAPNTYFITIKSPAGCITMDTTVINAAPVVPAAPSTTITQPTCTTASGTITINAPLGANYTYSIDGVTFQNGVTFSGLVSNTYTVTVKNADGCTATGAAIINMAPALPAAPSTTITQPTCTTPTGSVTITAPLGTIYSYSLDGTTFQNGVTFSNLSSNTYTVTVKNTDGCTATGTVIINAVPAMPATPSTTITQPTCTTPAGSVTVTAPVGTGYSYSIDGTNFQPGVTFSGLTPSIYTVTVKNARGCTATGTTIINMAPALPAAPSTTITQPTCTIPTGSVTITAPVGTGYSYSIDGTSFQPGITFSTVVSNTYIVTVKNTDGCTATGTAIINMAPALPAAPSTTTIQPTCTRTSGTITINAPLGANYSYSIDGTNFQPGVTFSGLVPNTYTVAVKNTDGCTATATTFINAAPVVPAVPSTVITQPTCTTLTGSFTITAPVGTGYSYSIDGINFQPGVTFSGLTSSTYAVTVKNAGGCTATGTAAVNPAPVIPEAAALTIKQPTCSTPTGNIIIRGPGGTGYSYSIDGTSFQDGNTFTGLAPKTYTVTVKNANGCTSSTPAIINTAPGAPPVPLSTVAQPTCTTLTGSITITSPLGANYSYSNDGTNFQSSPAFPGLPPATYTVSVKDGGCTSSGSVTIKNVSQTSIPTVNSPLHYCQNANAAPLTAVGSNLLWYTNLTGGTGSAIAPTPVTSGIGTASYYVSQTVNGCVSQRAVINILVSGNTISPITGNTFLCVSGVTASTLSNTTPGGTWSSANTSVAIVNNEGNITSVSPGSTVITYSLNSGGCNASASAIVSVENFTVSLGADPNPATQGTTINLNTTAATPYQVMAWLPAAAFPLQTATSQAITPANSGNYSVVARSVKGCVDTAQVAITVIPGAQDLFVPNAFTPNNDGNNDILLVYGNSIQSMDFRIFNQWGELIFQTADRSKGWDGKYKGVMQPVTVYVYILKATMQNGSVIVRKGSITLVR